MKVAETNPSWVGPFWHDTEHINIWGSIFLRGVATTSARQLLPVGVASSAVVCQDAFILVTGISVSRTQYAMIPSIWNPLPGCQAFNIIMVENCWGCVTLLRRRSYSVVVGGLGALNG